jgi:hypothetical protein
MSDRPIVILRPHPIFLLGLPREIKKHISLGQKEENDIEFNIVFEVRRADIFQPLA